MSDLIDRQAAIDTICKVCSIVGDYHKCNGYPETSTWCDELVALRALPSAQQWIPVSERLPEKSGRYLVTRGLNAAGNLWNRVYIINYSDLMGLIKEKIFWDGNVGKSDFQEIDDVVAWMPLPEPARLEETDG